MLGGILGRGFSAKSKSLIKLSKSRIDLLKRKRNATIMFLKKDLADLLANGLESNAYGRVGGLLDELRLLWNLEFVEKSGDFLLKQLSAMQKRSECPEECREAVASLMVAAAGFSELPELRDLRQLFQERYGDSVELYFNREFAENLSSKPYSKEKKVKLMEDIASEYSIRWDSNGFNKKMSIPDVVLHEQPKNYGPVLAVNDKYKSINGAKEDRHDLAYKQRAENYNKGSIPAVYDKYKSINGAKEDRHDIAYKQRAENDNNGRRLHGKEEESVSRKGELVFQSRQELSYDRQKPIYDRPIKSHDKEEEIILKRNDVALHQRKELPKERQKSLYDSPETLMRKDKHDNSIQGRRDISSADNQPINGKEDIVSVSSSRRTERHGTKYNNPTVGNLDASPNKRPEVAPYAKKSMDTDPVGNGEYNNATPKPYFNNALPPPYVKPNLKTKDIELGHEGKAITEEPSSRTRARLAQEIGDSHSPRQALNGPIQNEDVDNILPKPRSSRRRHSRSCKDKEIVNAEDPGVVKRKLRSRRTNPSQGLQILFDDEREQVDPEERMIDKLLMHYSKKPSASEQENVKIKSRRRHHHRVGIDQLNGSTNDVPNRVHPPRTRSLPNEHTTQPEKMTAKVFARAASFQPDGAAPHVHPKLPDYDDLAARFASLRGD